MALTVEKKKNGRKALPEPEKQGESMGIRFPYDIDQVLRDMPNRSEYIR